MEIAYVRCFAAASVSTWRTPKAGNVLGIKRLCAPTASPAGARTVDWHLRLSCIQRIRRELERRFPTAAEMLQDAAAAIVAFTGLPQSAWRPIWSSNAQERVNGRYDGAATSSASLPTARCSSA